jgi:hypothetical protein
MATVKKTKRLSAPEEIIVAFEAGIRFGMSMETRRPVRSPLWTEAEWWAALAKAIGTPPSETRKRK